MLDYLAKIWYNTNKEITKMKKVAFAITILFVVLTLIGAVLVICRDLNPGYAVIPCALAIVSSLFWKGGRA